MYLKSLHVNSFWLLYQYPFEWLMLLEIVYEFLVPIFAFQFQNIEFYHYGTSRELLSSTVAVQNLVHDQREIMHLKVKPHPAIFVQNALVGIRLGAENSEVWIENSCVGPSWRLAHRHIITGVPRNDWELELPAGTCIDVVPMGDTDYVARCYGFNDAFRGALNNEQTIFMGNPMLHWLSARGLTPESIEGGDDLQSARLFPVCNNVEELGEVFRWMICDPEYAERIRGSHPKRLPRPQIHGRSVRHRSCADAGRTGGDTGVKKLFSAPDVVPRQETQGRTTVSRKILWSQGKKCQNPVKALITKGKKIGPVKK